MAGILALPKWSPLMCVAVTFAYFSVISQVAGWKQTSVLSSLLSSKFTSFVKLLDSSDLLGPMDVELQSGKQMTLFAPTDEYLLGHVSPELLRFLTLPQYSHHLRKTLLHHMVPRRLSSVEWNSAEVGTYAGPSTKLDLSRSGATFRVNSVDVNELDSIEASDGLVHAIHGFLVPADVLDAFELFVQDSVSHGSADRRSFISFSSQLGGSQEIGSPAPAPGPSAPPPVPTPTPTPAPAPAPVPVPGTPNFTEIILKALDNAGNFSLFAKNLIRINLFNIFQSELEVNSTYLFLAPDDEAFIKAQPYLESLSAFQLDEVIRNHIVFYLYQKVSKSYDDLVTEASESQDYGIPAYLPTYDGGFLTLSTTGSSLFVEGVKVTYADILIYEGESPLGNIYIQGLSSVIIPSTASPPPPFVAPTPAPAPSPSAAPSGGVLALLGIHGVLAAICALLLSLP